LRREEPENRTDHCQGAALFLAARSERGAEVGAPEPQRKVESQAPGRPAAISVQGMQDRRRDHDPAQAHEHQTSRSDAASEREQQER